MVIYYLAKSHEDLVNMPILPDRQQIVAATEKPEKNEMIKTDKILSFDFLHVAWLDVFGSHGNLCRHLLVKSLKLLNSHGETSQCT